MADGGLGLPFQNTRSRVQEHGQSDKLESVSEADVTCVFVGSPKGVNSRKYPVRSPRMAANFHSTSLDLETLSPIGISNTESRVRGSSEESKSKHDPEHSSGSDPKSLVSPPASKLLAGNSEPSFLLFQKILERDEREREERKRVELERMEYEREKERHDREERKKLLDFLFEKEHHRSERDQTIIEKLEKTFSESVEKMSQNSGNVEKLKVLPMEEDEDMDVFLQRFERVLHLQRVPEDQWCTRLGVLLRGKAAELFSRLPIEIVTDFNQLKKALMDQYQLTSESFRLKFRSMKKDNNESFIQFRSRLDLTFERWIELSSKSDKNFDNLKDIIIVEQFLSQANPELDLFLRQHGQLSSVEYSKLADQFEEAKQSSRLKAGIKPKKADPRGKQGNKKSESEVDGETMNVSNTKQGNKDNQCYFCGSTSHFRRDCKKYLESMLATAKRVSFGLPEKTLMSIPENDRKFFHPSEIEGRPCLAMRDTGATYTLINESWAPKDAKIIGESKISLANGSKMIVKKIVTNVCTPFFSGRIVAAITPGMQDAMIIGNTVLWENGKETEVPVFVEAERATVACTRSQTRVLQPVCQDETCEVVPELKVTPAELRKLQSKDKSLFACFTLANNKQPNKGGSGSFVIKKGLLYRKYKGPHKPGSASQLVIPKELQKIVLSLGHDSCMAGHLGTKKTLDRIQTAFYWPGLPKDVRNYCRSCDVCQRTVPAGRTPRVPLSTMPVVDVPFQRVAVDLIGPLNPMSSQKHRYVLVLVDYATRFPDAIALKDIEASSVADALWTFWTRYGVPQEVVSDRGSQFTSQLLREAYSMLGVKGVFVTPYHAMANGLVEKFNACLKSMIRRLCLEKPDTWHLYIDAALFAYREVPQESTGYSPFELLYGRRVRGPLTVLKDLWSQEDVEPEVKSTSRYVFELRSKIGETCEIAQSHVKNAAKRYAKYYNRKLVNREFVAGDEVLLLLPTKRNKLQLSWRGPFKIVERVSSCDYRVLIRGKEKIYHANMLKSYYRRETGNVAALVIEEEDLNVEKVSEPDVVQCLPEQGITLPALVSREGPEDVVISDKLSDRQKYQIKELIKSCSRIFTDAPLRCVLGECSIDLETNDPVRVKQYPLPHSQQSVIEAEVKAMLEAGIIEHCSSPFSSPILLVKKKDSSMRFCIDFRRLNLRIIFDCEPMPDVDALFAKLGGSKYFSKLDLSKGYYQIAMKDSDKAKTAFTTPQGQFQFKVMPFGLKTAGAIFSRIMRELLAPLHMYPIQNFMDDILVASSTWDEHVNALCALFKRLNEVNMSARPTKCALGFREVSFLGHRVSEGSVHPEEDKVSKISHAPRPETKKQVRSFLGLAGYYRKFVENYASIARPLTDLTKKSVHDPIPWEQKHQDAFDLLKGRLTSEPILILPDLSKQFVLRTDASGKNLGACLMQDQGKGLQPIAFASKKLSDTEQKYSTIEQECFAVVFGIRKFYPYLYGRQFIVETDHHPLQYMARIRPSSRRLAGWAMELQSHDFIIRSIPGKENVVSDYLSRME